MARKAQNSSISIPHGRKRTLAPGFFTDSALLSLSPLHRLFFEGLWCYADKAGRLLDRPIDLKIRILPLDAFDPEQGLRDLVRAGLLVRYHVDGLSVIAMKPRAWREVQRVHPNEPDSELPEPPKGIWTIKTPDAPPILVHQNPPESPHSALGIFVPAGPSGSSGPSGPSSGPPVKAHQPALLPELEPPPPPPRALSWQQRLWEEMRTARIGAAQDVGGTIATEDDLGPAFINTALTRACEKLGWNNESQRENLILVWAEFLLLPKAAAKGWPLRYFLHDAIFEECRLAEEKRTTDQPTPDRETAH